VCKRAGAAILGMDRTPGPQIRGPGWGSDKGGGAARGSRKGYGMLGAV
jgi:hypothetical protein